MNKQAVFPMSNELTLELIRSFLQPGMPTLGMWLGWNQPDKDDVVKLGSAYAVHSEEFWWETAFEDATLDQKKEFVRICKMYKKNLRDKLTVSGLMCAEEVFFPYAKLSKDEQCLYRLHTMAVNTGNDYHNWAIEYGEMLAHRHADSEFADVKWELYEEDNSFSREMFEFITNNELWDIIPYSMEIEPPYAKAEDADEDLLEWLEEYIGDYSGDFFDWMFGVPRDGHSWWEDDVIPVLAWFMEWMQDEWKTGNLELTPDTPSQKLNDFITMVNAQEILPGF